MSGIADKVRRELGSMLRGLDAETLRRRPAARPEAWSIQQIGEHLRISYDLTIYAYQEQMLKGRCTQARATFHQMVLRWMLRLGFIPRGRKASEIASPPEAMQPESGAALLERVMERMRAMQAVMEQVDKTQGGQRCVGHHLFGPLSSEEWLRFHLLHARLHARQVRAILRETPAETPAVGQKLRDEYLRG